VQAQAKFEISIKYLSKLHLITGDSESAAHRLFFPQKDNLSIDMLVIGHNWLTKLIDENAGKHIFPEPEFTGILADRWLFLCIKARYNGLKVMKLYWNSRLRRPLIHCIGEIIKLVLNRPYRTS
jgi:hypothetical protein